MYYPCNENKRADQVRSYCTIDLRLCFHIHADYCFSGAAAQMHVSMLFLRMISIQTFFNHSFFYSKIQHKTFDNKISIKGSVHFFQATDLWMRPLNLVKLI